MLHQFCTTCDSFLSTRPEGRLERGHDRTGEVGPPTPVAVPETSGLLDRFDPLRRLDDERSSSRDDQLGAVRVLHSSFSLQSDEIPAPPTGHQLKPVRALPNPPFRRPVGRCWYIGIKKTPPVWAWPCMACPDAAEKCPSAGPVPCTRQASGRAGRARARPPAGQPSGSLVAAARLAALGRRRSEIGGGTVMGGPRNGDRSSSVGHSC